MRVAALYDIHANLPALEAVVAELGTVDLVLVGGDVVWGPWPQETMDLLTSLSSDVAFIMGNADRDVFDRVEGSWKASNDWCADRLSATHLDRLRSAPATRAIDGVLYCHGSPRRDTDPITLRTSAAQLDEWCNGVRETAIVCGHTHGQFDIAIGSRRVVNAGSIGNPFGAPGAYWAIVDDDMSLRCTPYDVEATASRIRATGFPYGDVMASQIVATSTPEDAAKRFTG